MDKLMKLTTTDSFYDNNRIQIGCWRADAQPAKPSMQTLYSLFVVTPKTLLQILADG